MDNNILLEYLRNLAHGLSNGNIEEVEQVVETLHMAQDHLALIYSDYEQEDAPAGAEMLRELMMEALQLMFLGVDEFLNYLESPSDELLTKGLALVEEGNDIMSSIKHSVESSQEWDSSSALG